MHGSYSAAGIGSNPSVTVQIEKLGNGYVVAFAEYPKRTAPPTVVRGNPFEGLDPDEIIDKMVDGMGAMIRVINDKGAGENWKGEEDRQQIREAFRVMFPQLAGHANRVVEGGFQDEPRRDDLVFETKTALLKYLTENL